jgi:Acyl CoA:acetate/3-ketoacid CoA transferase, alpha subunit
MELSVGLNCFLVVLFIWANCQKVQTGELPVRYNRDGTVAEKSKPKETREFNGKQYVLEEAIFGDYALVKVHKADKLGNCQFRKAMNNFNEAMGKNAKVTLVEADHIVEVGEIAPEDIHLQGIYVDKVIQSTEPKKIEKLTFAKNPNELLQAGKSIPRVSSLTLTDITLFIR